MADLKSGTPEFSNQIAKIRKLIDSGVKEFVLTHTTNGKIYNTVNSGFPVPIGTKVTLSRDDGTDIPWFIIDGWFDDRVVCLARLEPLSEKENKMNIVTELEQKLKETLELTEKLKKEIEEAKNVPTFGWEPKDDEEFYWVRASGCITSDYWSNDNNLKSMGNYFKTWSQAQDYVDALKVIAELRKQPGRKKFVRGEDNWALAMYDMSLVGGTRTITISLTQYSSYMISFGQVFFDSQESAQAAINVIGEERIKKAILTLTEM